MSTTPHFWPTLTGKIHPEAELAVKMAFNALQEHEQGLSALNTKILALQAQTTAATTTTTTTTDVTTTTTVPVGTVNTQTGTSYTVQNSDSGGIITFSNAAAVAVTLNAAVAQFWYAALANLGAGLVTITPQSGTINGGATLALSTQESAWIFFDGTNWWAATIPTQPQALAAVASQFFTSYTATTGLFTAAQPAIADVLGLAAALALLAPLASPTFTGTVTQPTPAVLTAAATASTATLGAGGALPTLPAAYLEISVNGTSYKVALYNP